MIGYSMFSIMTLRTELGQPCCWGTVVFVMVVPVAVSTREAAEEAVVPVGEAPPATVGVIRLKLVIPAELVYDGETICQRNNA